MHPDRNYGNVEAATKLFADVQCAYEVLSDQQERAWYDSHLDAVISDDKVGHGKQAPDNYHMTASKILGLLFKFNPRMEFSDSPTGFYGGLKDLFDEIAREEELACRREKIQPIIYPSFGGANDDFEEVVRPFYAAWNGFSTRKSFAWKDIHRYSEAPDRRIRRLMEKENKRLRDEGIREYNDAVRSLVVFVKKRDPRYKSYNQNEAERQRMLRELAAAQAARSRAANQAKVLEHVTPEWARTKEMEEEYYNSSESGSDIEHFECVVCNKTFKSEKQFEAHERSKKHIKAVRQLRWEMKIQDEELHVEPTDSRKSAENLQEFDTLDTSTVDQKVVFDSTLDVTHETSSEPQMENQSFSASEGDNGDYDTREAVEGRMATSVPRTQLDSSVSVSAEQVSVISDSDHSHSKTGKLGKAKQKRARKASRMAATETSQLTCKSCHASFPSRTQLFSHIRDENHAEPTQKLPKDQRRRNRPG